MFLYGNKEPLDKLLRDFQPNKFVDDIKVLNEDYLKENSQIIN